MRRISMALSVCLLAVTLAAGSPAEADLGDVQQLSGTDGCVSEDGTGGACADGVGLQGALAVAVSPDDKNVYVGGGGSKIAIFDRNPTTGALTQKSGTEGCVAGAGDGLTCADGVALNNISGPQAVTVSPDNKNVYVAAKSSDSVAIFDRDLVTGSITQKPAPDGCISTTGTGGNCQVGRGLDLAFGVVVSSDGETAYVTSAADDGGIAIFDRDTTTGELTQKPGTAGCISETGTGGLCADGNALDNSETMAISSDGENLYLAAFDSRAISIFDRDTTTGELTQKAGTAGCISDTGTGGTCAQGRGLHAVNGIAMSPDDANVYGAALVSDAISIFDRDPATGELTQKPGTAGCIQDSGLEGCADGVALDGPEDVTVAKDGRTVHSVSRESGALNIFVRNVRTGELTQKSGTAGCVSETGNGGACAIGVAMAGLNSIADSADQQNVYLAAHGSNAVDIFGRDLVDVEPTGVDDAATVSEDAAATTIDVQANDDDPDGGANTIDSVTQPPNGTVTITNGGADLSYEPDADYCNDGDSTDDFTYTLNGGSTATVRVTVTCVDDPPTAVDDDVTVSEDSTATTIDVLSNDNDVDGGTNSIESITQPANGTVTITNGGADLTYEPDADYCNDGASTDDFTYTLNGGSTATVRVTVTCVDDPPTAVDDDVTVSEGPSTTIDVQANDDDPDGGANTIDSVTQPPNGTVTITNGGADLSYEPDADYCNDGASTDDFTYTLNGGSTATVRVTVICDFIQPDVQVKLTDKGEYVGDDIYNATGEDQWVLTNKKRGKKVTFDFSIENDSTRTETFAIWGNHNNRAYTAKYFDGETNVTREVVAGRFSTGPLAPGEAKQITAVVKLKKADNNYNIKRVRVLASGRRDAQDMAMGRVRPKGKPRPH